MQTFRLPKKTLLLWRLRVSVPGVLLTAAAVFAAWRWTAAIFAAPLFGGLTLWADVWYLPRYFRSFLLKIGKNGVTVHRGVIFQRTQILPFPRFIYGTFFATPLARAWQLRGILLCGIRVKVLIPETQTAVSEIILAAFEGKE